MFGQALTTTFGAIAELVLLGAAGFWLVRRKIVFESGLTMLSDLIVGLTLPLFIFSQIVSRFRFDMYPDWWVFPLLSIVISGVGLAFGYVVLRVDKPGVKYPEEFLGLVTFQNSGYLPLPLVASLLPVEAANQMFIYIFLFLLGFNMMIFSVGVYLLSPASSRKFEARRMFNAPVIATLLALVIVAAGAQKFLPGVLMRPAESLGRCTIPLSIMVIGGNLALMKVADGLRKPLVFSLTLKLIVLPLFFLGVIVLWRPGPLMALLILLQAAMPPAVLLSVVCRSQDCADKLTTPAIFYGHLASIITIPLVLILFRFFSQILY